MKCLRSPEVGNIVGRCLILIEMVHQLVLLPFWILGTIHLGLDRLALNVPRIWCTPTQNRNECGEFLKLVWFYTFCNKLQIVLCVLSSWFLPCPGSIHWILYVCYYVYASRNFMCFYFRILLVMLCKFVSLCNFHLFSTLFQVVFPLCFCLLLSSNGVVL